MKLGTRLLLIGLIGLPLVGCGDDDDDGSSGTDRAAKVVAASLTSNVLFADGVVKTGEIPPTSASTVSLKQEDQVLSLAPKTAEILTIEFDNPDEEDDPVTATLMQFEDDEKNHIEVDKESGGDAGSDNEIALEFMVDDDVCANLCDDTFTLTMIQAVKLKSGKISKRLKREIRLDCSDDGDPDKCEKASSGGAGGGATGGKGGSGSSGKGGSSGGGGALEPTTVAMEFANALGLANLGLCKCPAFSKGACAAMLPQTALSCIQDAAASGAENGATAGMLASLTAKFNSIVSACNSCDYTTCDPDLLADELTKLPSEVRGAFEQCATDKDGMIGGNLPDAGASP